MKGLKLLPYTCDSMAQFFFSPKSYLVLHNDGTFTVDIEITDLIVTHGSHSLVPERKYTYTGDPSRLRRKITLEKTKLGTVDSLDFMIKWDPLKLNELHDSA